ncbi:restriction endonuclease subunit S [Streptomyces rubiginosohelvolus]|uniref:restriction endonuclease subunit S n=1 Tax=Streptomyces rubiginosohelvolus TaxID=67362 RepID=UPI0036E36D4D
MTPVSKQIPYGPILPESWGVVPLKHLATLQNGYVFKSEGWADSGTPIIRIENLNGSESFNLSGLTVNEKHHVRSGDLLFSWSGNPGTSFGPYRWRKSGLYFLNQHIFKVSVQGCEKDWLYWTLRAATFWIERELTSGMIGMVHVTKEELSNVPIPIPSRDEQRRIAHFLDVEIAKIDRLAELRRSMLARLEERERSVRDGLVERMFEQRGELPLRRFTAIIEQGESPQCEAASRDSVDEWAVLKLSSVRRGIFESEENKRLPPGAVPNRSCEIQAGDLLVTRANTPNLVGDVAVASGRCERLLLPDLIYRVKLGAGILPAFAAQVALSGRVRAVIESSARGSSQSMVKLRGEDIKAWPMPRVTTEQQRELIRAMERTTAASGRLRESIVCQLALLTERRRALITAAVTGQLDVTTARPAHDRDL